MSRVVVEWRSASKETMFFSVKESKDSNRIWRMESSLYSFNEALRDILETGKV
jgi:hypothetical protein